MKTRYAILGLTALSIGLGPTLEAAGIVNYVRPVVAYAQPTESEADSGAGGFLQFGGGDETYDLSLEIGYLKFDQTIQVDEIYSGEEKLEFVPLLITPKWRVNLDQKGTFAFLIGPSVGLTYAAVRVNVFENDERIYRITDNGWSFTYGLDAQFRISPSEKIDLTLGYKFLLISGIVVEDENIRVDTGDQKSHILYAGIGFHF